MRALARALHRALLLLYPRGFRQDWGESMRATFEDAAREEGWLSALAREVRDVARTATGLRLEAFRARRRPELGGVAKDIVYAMRSLRRSPSFTIVATLSLALGIGLNAAIVSLVDGLLLRPMPVEDPQSLVALYSTRENERFPLNFSYPTYLDLSGARDVFSDVVGFQGAALSVDFGRERPELLWGEVVTANYFTGLEVPMELGRGFLAGEVDEPVTILSHELWRRRFDASPGALGRTLVVNGHELTIVGVARRGFTGAKLLGFTPGLWVPVGLHSVVWPGSERRLEDRSGGWLNVRARLAPGVSACGAEAALGVLASRLEREHPELYEDWRLHAIPAARKTEPVIHVELGGILPAASGVLLALVGIVLLIASANVASLQLARSLARQKELAIRLSLGATRARIVRQLVLEILLVAVAGLALGLALATQLLRAALALGPSMDFSVDFGARIDGRVGLATAGLALAAGLISGLLPAWRTARRDVQRTLKETRSAASSGRGRRFLVVPQVALSLVALVCAGLLVSSFRNAGALSPGFSTRDILLASVDLGLQGYTEEEGRAFLRSTVERLETVPGVASVSLAYPLPLDAMSEGWRVSPRGATGEDERMLVFMSLVGERYFETMSTPLVSGRAFAEGDDEDARPVAIVNETLASSFWPGESALGRELVLGDDGTAAEVVGVARDGKYLTLGEEPRPFFFLPFAQHYRSPVTIVMETSAPPRSLEPALRAAIARLDPTLPVYGVKTIGELVDRTLSGARAMAILVTTFAVLALVLTTIGIYGLMSFLVSTRRHELGIRMALGAERSRVIGLFLGEAGRVVASGLVIGLVLAWASARAISSLLYGVDPTSPLVFAAVSLGLVVVALIGSYLPSRRAAKLDPLTTLRHE